jgi:type II secretory pathway component PulM
VQHFITLLIVRWGLIPESVRLLLSAFTVLITLAAMSWFLFYRPFVSAQNALQELRRYDEQLSLVQNIAAEAKKMLDAGIATPTKVFNTTVEMEKAVQDTVSFLNAKEVKVQVQIPATIHVQFSEVAVEDFKKWLQVLRTATSSRIDKVVLRPTDQGIIGDVDWVFVTAK